MTALCPVCGTETDAGLCAHHGIFLPWDKWAEANRICCDFFHRGVVLDIKPAPLQEAWWWKGPR